MFENGVGVSNSLRSESGSARASSPVAGSAGATVGGAASRSCAAGAHEHQLRRPTLTIWEYRFLVGTHIKFYNPTAKHDMRCACACASLWDLPRNNSAFLNRLALTPEVGGAPLVTARHGFYYTATAARRHSNHRCKRGLPPRPVERRRSLAPAPPALP